jgi:hypothetical protein
MARRVSLFPDQRYTCRLEQRGDGRWTWLATFKADGTETGAYALTSYELGEGVKRSRAAATRAAERACRRHRMRQPVSTPTTETKWHPHL